MQLLAMVRKKAQTKTPYDLICQYCGVLHSLWDPGSMNWKKLFWVAQDYIAKYEFADSRGKNTAADCRKTIYCHKF